MAVRTASAVIDVSVIVPVFNKGRYLSELLDSLRRQTSDSFEVWLIDDGSTDGSGHPVRPSRGLRRALPCHPPGELGMAGTAAQCRDRGQHRALPVLRRRR